MLNFVKIELRGFKSFADKVEIPFNEGVTAIIGPNGCGKSNVADAIRWTLGEKSAKQLRGKSMQDVIFAGTEKRRSMSYCEVSLTFNNEGQRLFPALPFDEVVITRKLDRGGLSEYFINHNKCRLSDITELLHDTGMGKEGYSIIGQGRVDEIMSAKPDDRRHIFEEAAGISKFRAKRTESERNLEKAKLNLQTANELIAEIEKQIHPLRHQAEVAQKYFDLKEQLKYNEVNLYVYNYENTQAVKQKISDKINSCELQLKVKNAEYSDYAKRYDACMSESSTIDKTLEDYNAELRALKVDAAKFESGLELVKERITNSQNAINRINGELEDIDAQLIANGNAIKNATDSKEQEFANYLAISKEYEAANEKLSRLTSTLEGNESDIQARNREYIDAVEKLQNLTSNMSSYQAIKAINEERVKNLTELIAQKQERLNEEKTTLAINEGRYSSAKKQLAEATSEYNENLSNKLDAQEAIKANADDITALNNKLASAKATLTLYMAVKDDYEGYQHAVSNLMKDSKHDPNLSSKVLGVLAQLISVPPQYEAAIEYALGGAMQNIVVENETDARDLIAYLKQKNYGRVTFRPISACRPRELEPECRGALNEPGCIGLASSLVACDKKYQRVVNSLLGNTVVVNNIDNAIRLYKKYNQAFKIVTLDGEIFARGGEISGGSRRNQTQGLLSQESRIEQAKANVEKIERNIEMVQKLRLEKEKEVEECNANVEELASIIGNLRIEMSVANEKIERSNSVINSLNGELENDMNELAQAKAAIENVDNELSAISELEKVVAEKKGEFEESLSSSQTESAKQKSERNALTEMVMELRVKVNDSKKNLDVWDQELYRLGREQDSLQDDKQTAIAELRKEQSNLESILQAPERTSFSKEDKERIDFLDSEILQLSARKRTIFDEIAECDAKKNQLNNEIVSLTEQKSTLIGRLENVDVEIRNQQEHILEEYDLTYAGAAELKDPEFKAYGAVTVINDLKKSIARLGDVNFLAAASLKEAEERLVAQTTQRDDILQACTDIETVIAELTVEMRDKFIDAFDKISENFKEVFSQLFGGGKGELRLNTQETDDVLEAGIDIFAQPPGKKLQNMSLLSGGERALTAIAILFSILRLKPMPFCLLDEIEAALDDGNINLFAAFLKKFSDYTQFIVITHRKPTMRYADTIFGVTMEEKGVTKIVSIEFEDALKQTGTSDN